MQVIIDLDSHSAIQNFTNRSPAGAYQFKSQDTVEWEIYFVQNGLVQDLGAGFALKFGMIKTGDTAVPPTLLAYQTVFNYLTDVNGNTYYSGLVNFNTSQMATAIGTSPSIQGTAEIRYQDSLNEIIHTINISTVVYATILVETGVTPPGVSSGYPDASTIELLVHKNAASGYAGLTSGAKLISSTIPVDNQTVKIDTNGNIVSSQILASITANFTTPAVNANVSITVNSTTSIKPSSFVYIPTAGYYLVLSITDSTHCVISNNGDPFNAASGVTISSGTVVLPAQAATGGGGGGSGQPAYTSLTTGFTVPAVGAAVNIVVGNTSWMGGSGYGIFITGAGYYLVSAVTDVNNLTVTNTGSGSNSVPGSTVSSGGTVSAAGPMGPAGASGSALSGYDSLAAAITMPAANGTVTIQISNTAWLGVGQVIYIASGGYFSVASIVNTTNANVTNLNYPGNVSSGTSIPSGSKVSPGGLQGPQGAGGAGLNAFTTLTNSFTQPAVSTNVTIKVGTTAWMAVGEVVYIANGGYYTIASVSDLTTASATNLGYSGNTTAGGTVASGSQVTPSGLIGIPGSNPYTTTTASFTMPAVNASVTITVNSTSFMVPGQNIFVQTAGYFIVASVTDANHVVATNSGAAPNAAPSASISAGSGVSTAGANGVAGAAGPPGAAGRDGAYSTVYTQYSVSGNGGASSPVQLVNDVAQASNPYAVYQRDVSGNSLWAPIPTDGTTMTVSAGKLKSIDPLDAIGAHIETPSVKSYTLDLSAPVAYTITGLVAVTSSGTCTVNLQRNGATIIGASALSITSTLSTTTLSQAITAGDKITLQVTATSSGADLQLSMRIQK